MCYLASDTVGIWSSIPPGKSDGVENMEGWGTEAEVPILWWLRAASANIVPLGLLLDLRSSVVRIPSGICGKQP